MGKTLLTLLFASLLACTFSTAVLAQEAPAAKEKVAKEARWEGTIVRSDPEKSTLTVRKSGSSSTEMAVEYDSSTKWVSQYHGDKKVNDIDSSQVKDGDFVICKGTWDKPGRLHATLISKRLSHSDK
ncbi:MAG: hypothetical protein ACRD20_08555 [Terriglobales bacterium]